MRNIIIILFFFQSFGLYSQQTNLDIVKNLFSLASDSIIFDIKVNDIKEISINLPNSESTIFFEQIFLGKCQENNVKVLVSGGTLLDISITEIIVNYYLMEHKDSLKRTIEVNLFYKYSHNNSIKANDVSNLIFNDNILFDDTQFIESKDFSFTKSKLPKKKSTFFEKYVEASAITIAAILTVVLLFTIRSN